MIPSEQLRCHADDVAVADGCYWSQEAADRPIRFIEAFCRPAQGRKAKDAFRLFAWQRDVLARLFGWMRADGTRRFRTGFVTLARQNGKSFLAAAICLYMLLADNEVSPAVASAACSREQAAIVFEAMSYCCSNNAKLAETVHVVPYRKTILAPATNGVYKSLSVDATTSLGPSYSCVVLDELAFHKSSKLADALRPTQAAREQPLLIAITTAGTDFSGPGYDMYQYAAKVRDGVSDDTSFFYAIYEADEGCAVDDPAQWHKANPSLCEGTLSLDELRDASTKAKHSKADACSFNYYRLNRWTRGLTSYLSVDAWDRCRGVYPDLKGQPLYLGLDLASSKDLTAVVGVVPYQGKLFVIHKAWAPAAAAEQREKENRHRYSIFADEGSLVITPGNGTDFRKVRDHVKQLAQDFALKEVICDPNYGGSLMMELMEDGHTVYRFAQSPRMYSDPMKRLATLVADRAIVHDGAELLRWQCQNLQVEITGEDLHKPSKGKSADKIDSLCALVMALSRAGVGEVVYKPRVSCYENMPIFIVG